jgi:hypothetical protein
MINIKHHKYITLYLILNVYNLSHFSKGTLIASQKKNITPINEKIRASEVMLIGSNGEKQGLVAFLCSLGIS